MKVKICGITHLDDALCAESNGADYLGLIFSNQSRRVITPAYAKLICAAVTKAEIVGVFVAEPLAHILALCQQLSIKTLQIHRPLTEDELIQLQSFTLFYPSPYFQTDLLKKFRNIIPLFDHASPGRGKTFDWDSFTPPATPWILAGGLTPENITHAINLLHPAIVDIASGVEKPNSVRKETSLMKNFIHRAKQSCTGSLDIPFGGQFLPEILMSPILNLSQQYETLRHDPSFNQELNHLFTHYSGRPTPLTEIANFAKAIHGPRIFLKREDLLHTGAHKINNALGQCLLAKMTGKKRIIAETGAGQHGVATATACARLGLSCVIYMGTKDIERQRPNVDKMQRLGATLVPVAQGSATLKDAINEALRDWATHYETTHYCIGSALGPHPYPAMVRQFQSVISLELKAQLREQALPLPDMLLACVGGGSNAIGFFHHFLEETAVQLVGVEAGGTSLAPGQHAARFQGGKPGVLHGCYTYLLQDAQGQILPTQSISAGLDYPAVGPDHATLYRDGRAQYVSACDEEALQAFHLLAKSEGIIPALESSHALGYLMRIAPTLPRDALVVVNLSGRGEKDLNQIIARESAA